MVEICKWFVWALSWQELESEGGYAWPYRLRYNELTVCEIRDNGANTQIYFYDLPNVRELYEKYAGELTGVFDEDDEHPSLSWDDFYDEVSKVAL